VPKKLVLAVIDSLKPDMLDQAVAEGEAPALAALLERGTYVRDCVSTFPSVTPVASAAIATGYGPGEHHIPSMNWFHRGEERYVEYGSSLQATRAFGIVRSLYDTVYNMNLAHLSRAHRTVFEHLDDAGLRTACTT
jgi:predicted AlkP superfamily pyrophosphatase or phosphodiesterase